MTNMTRRVGLALALAVLGPAQAQAALITGFAQGTITINLSSPMPGRQVYNFTPGERLFLTFSFDSEGAEFLGGSATQAGYIVRPASFWLITEGGYQAGSSLLPFRINNAVVTDGPTDAFRLLLGNAFNNVDIRFSDPTGTALSSTALPTLAEINRFPQASVTFYRGSINGDEAFMGIVAPVADTSDFPIPEPSTFALGGIGLGILGLGYARRRRERTTA